MKIIKLRAENVKKLQAIEITPTENTVVISGRNGQGKTSVLDSIWFALAGKDAMKNTVRPIRDGQKKASVTLDLGEYVVTRSWTDNDKTYLKVENKQGASFKSPQAMLDALIGRLSFDPLAFAGMDDKAQLKTLMGLVDLPIDPAALDAKKKGIYDQRTEINREVKRLEGQLAGLKEPSPDVPEEEVSATSVMTELREAQKVIEENNQQRATLKNWKTEAENISREIDGIDKELERLTLKKNGLIEAAVMLGEKIEKGEYHVSALVDPDLDSYQVKLAQVEETNAAVRNAKKYFLTLNEMNLQKVASGLMTEQIEKIEQEKEEALKAAKFPIDGLSFDENGVTYQGIPFSQCSDAEKLRVSMAMAMALNPQLRVIRITNGSLLDADNMRLINEMASDKDYQVWVEVVDSTGKLGIYIEDGMVKEVE
jgi:DNA repair exonuclease SbcCD ATPase subunit